MTSLPVTGAGPVNGSERETDEEIGGEIGGGIGGESGEAIVEGTDEATLKGDVEVIFHVLPMTDVRVMGDGEEDCDSPPFCRHRWPLCVD